MLSLGALYTGETLQWALLERTKLGWAVSDAGVDEAPFETAVKRTSKKWKGTRPYVGLDWRRAEVSLTNLGEPRNEILATIRTQRGDPKRLVEYVADGKARLVFDADRAEVTATLTAWRKLGIEPIGLEPVEAAWIRTSASLDEHDAIIDMRSTPPVLLAMANDMVFNEMIRFDNPGDDGAIIQAIRRARSEGSAMRSILVLGDLSEHVRSEEGSASKFTTLSIIGEDTPAWADAFALASAADAQEAAKIEKAARVAEKKALAASKRPQRPKPNRPVNV